ncbi:hypothetical protein BS47DRAFT_1341238 [Hydnum rufescens UP504]|uniref:Phytase n=1 Tax=Hydnum rufescens UP504 TaxID=1448309 RepID=A0A9P6DWA1_9AGAM|nr:hypothetical protein BS47DRAFT_1341238 [Hydnum rufescens UP504]
MDDSSGTNVAYIDKTYDSNGHTYGEESESLLPEPVSAPSHKPLPTLTSSSRFHVALAFVAGILACLIGQYFFPSLISTAGRGTPCSNRYEMLSSPYAGSKVAHKYPPASATNDFPSYFPTDVGYAGPTPTGAEPGIIATAPSYPLQNGPQNLLGPSNPSKTIGKGNATFDIFKYWGNLSPWYSVPSQTFGLDTTPDAPEGCRITGLHFLHRHGARYPTSFASFAGPARFAQRLRNASADGKEWEATGDLKFLNNWTYKLGGDLLTPFGRQQLFDLGVSMRLKYGFLLQNFTEKQALPVFRTESQDRMLYSALNFAIGFFGYPHQDKYLQSITIEAPGFNNTLAPYKTCPNAHIPSKADRSIPYLREWIGIYLNDARERLQKQIVGFDLTIEDTYVLQQLCAYETVALGYSKFCELFTEEEWEGFEYALDLYFWYTSAFGSPVARILGVGYIAELVSRLTETRIETHNTSTNATLDDNDITFPFGHSLYVDATHEVVVLHIITALNLTNFATDGPLPADHIPPNRKFIASQLAPFATNIQFQLLSCSSTPTPSQIRIIINDGVTPLTSIAGCPDQKDGMCPVDTFVEAEKTVLREADWEWDCHGDWQVPPGTAWNTTTGNAPKRPTT